MRPPRPSRTRAALTVLLAGGMLALAACAPETAPTPAPTSTGDPTPESVAPSATGAPTATPDATAGDEIAVPARCEDIYSADMLAALESQNPPLNDPGVTMYSTEIVEALEIIEAGAPSIRCSWGVPSEVGLATNVTIVDAAEAALLLERLPANGLACESFADGTLCRVSAENSVADFGETHFVRGNGWVATHWINFDPEGYTEDIVRTLWG